jgi:hypothetical protein
LNSKFERIASQRCSVLAIVDVPLRKRERHCNDGACSAWTFGYLAKYSANGSRVTVGGASSPVKGQASLVLRRHGGDPSLDLDVTTSEGGGTTTRTALRCALGGASCTVVAPIGFPSSALYAGASPAPHFDVGVEIPARASARCFYARIDGRQSTGAAFDISPADIASSLMLSASFGP